MTAQHALLVLNHALNQMDMLHVDIVPQMQLHERAQLTQEQVCSKRC
jgi:hypothetical protein